MNVIEALLGLTVKLDEGGYGYVYSIKVFSKELFLWQCHLCDMKGADVDSLTLHNQSKEHMAIMALPSHPQNKFTKIEKNKMKIYKDLRNLTIEQRQPAPPGTEDVMEIKPCKTTQLQPLLDSYMFPLIGLQYIVEVLHSGIGQEPYYMCMLCDEKYDPRTVLGHLTSFLHRYKYVTKYFPTFTAALQKKFVHFEADREQISHSVAKAVAKIEEKFGRLRPIYVEKEEYFEEKKEMILKKILEDNHLKETPSETFIEVLDESNENAFVELVDIEQEAELAVRHRSQFEALLELNKNHPFVGLDYFVEIRNEKKHELTYFCTLCEKKGNPHVMVGHLTSLNHCIKFIGQHFPKTKEVLNNRFKDKKHLLPEALRLICAKIEKKYGRKSPTVVNKMVFKSNRENIIRKLIGSKHFWEPLDDTFIGLIDKQMMYLKSLSLDDELYSTKEEHVSKQLKLGIESILAMLSCIRQGIGLEYLIELTSSNPDKESKFICAYCDKKDDPWNIKEHFISPKHCAKYINEFFPTAKKTILYLVSTAKECKNGVDEMIMILCARIQKEYGFLKPRRCDEDYFETNKKFILNDITNGEHLRETLEENFVAFIKEKWRDTNSLVDLDTAQNPIPTLLTVPQMSQLSRSAIPKMQQSAMNQIPIMPVTPLRMNLLPPAMSTPPPANSLVYTQNILASGRTSVRLQVPIQKSIEGNTSKIAKSKGRNNPTAREIRSLIEIEIKSFPVEHKSCKKAEHADWESLKSPEKSRSRSRSPSDTEFGKLSPGDKSLQNTLKWEIYVSKFKKVKQDIIKDINYYQMNPEKHPMYEEEWKRFWNDWFNRMKNEEKGPEHNIMPEWIKFWNKRVQELFKQKFENMKQDLKHTCGLNTFSEPVNEENHEEKGACKDRDNKRRAEWSNSGSPPPKQERKSKEKIEKYQYSRDQDTQSKEKTQWKETSKERTLRKFSNRSTQERKYSRENSHGKSSEKSQERGMARRNTQDRKLSERESTRNESQNKKSIEKTCERERKSSQVSQSVEFCLKRPIKKEVLDEESNEENKHMKSTVINTGLVSVLRFAAALENQLGSLGPQVNALLGNALSLEKVSMFASETLLANPEHFSLLETVKEKFRGQLMAKIVDKNVVSATERCVDTLERILTLVENNSALSTSKKDGTLRISNKTETSNPTASTVIDSLLKSGTFLSPPAGNDTMEKVGVQQAEDLNAITKSVLTAEAQRAKNLNRITPLLSTVAFPRATGVETVTISESNTIDKVAIAQQISLFLIKEGRYDVTQEELVQLINYVATNQAGLASSAGFAPQMQQQQQKQSYPGMSSGSDVVEHLSNEDLNNLLLNFQVLPLEEQQALIKYLKMLEVSCPDKVNKLREHLNIDSIITSRALNNSQNFGRPSQLLGRREQIEMSHTNVSLLPKQMDASMNESNLLRQFRERGKPSAELQKMKELAEDFKERKSGILRQITSGHTTTPSRSESGNTVISTRNHYQDTNSCAVGTSYGSQFDIQKQLQSDMWSEKPNRK